MLSRARNGGASGPLGPQPGRASDSLRPPSRGFTPPGQSAAPRRSGTLSDYDAPEAGAPQRPSGRPSSGRWGDPLNEPTTPGAGGRRRPSGPTERGRNGGGLLSFARAASSTMRAIITGKHRASQSMRSAQPVMDGAPPFSPETDEEHPKPRPYRRSRTRLVIHKRWERRTQHSQRMLIASIASGFMVAIMVGVGIFGTTSVSAFYQDTKSNLDKLANPNGFPQTTRFYDRNGVLLWEMLGANDNNAAYSTYVPYALFPDYLINATVDTEDKTFWTNSGIDVTSIIRAGIANVTNQEITQGGSTITQQLMKQAFFVDQRTGVAAENLQRKAQEALMSYAVTQQYSKQKILEFYLNLIPYGYLSRGIEAAAENYFGLLPKQDPQTHQLVMGVQQLTLPQAALLAGLPQGPSLYSPCGSDDGVNDRRAAALQRMHDVVLTSMLAIGDITQQQFDDADAAAHKPDFFVCRDEGTKLAPHFVDYVRDEIAMMLTTDGTLATGINLLAHAGWNIYTTIDVKLENQVESIVKKYLFQPHLNHYTFEQPPAGQTAPPLSYPQSKGGHNINDSAVVVMDPNTGDILAMDGSGDYHKASNIRQGGQYNAATSRIQSGSSFKPIVFAAAFEEGWFPSLVIQDQFTCFPVPVDPNKQDPKARAACGKWYAPVNYGGGFATGASIGEKNAPPKPGIRVREALGNSLNITAVQALYFAGLPNVINLAERMGITSQTFSPEQQGPSIALGSAAVRLLDMTDAYSVFANGGFHVAPRSVLLITDSQGNVIPNGDFHTVTRTQVLSPQTAFLITSILADNNSRIFEFGNNNALTFHNAPYVAAKTGTTENFKDNLTMGYSPYLTVGVWSGNANGNPMSPNTIGITGAAPIWHDVMTAANKLFKYPNSYWHKPAGVGLFYVNADTGLAPYQGTQGNYLDWFNDAALPDLS
jgi:membrane peptidoglycan carboxypeptidase